MKCELCKLEKGRHVCAVDVQESSTDKYKYKNKTLCDDCMDDLMYEGYLVRSTNFD